MGSIISMVFISLEGFLPSILLLVVVIVTAIIVAVILIVVNVAIDGVVIVVMIIGVEDVVTIIGVVVVGGGVSFIIKLSLVIIGFLHMIMFCYLSSGGVMDLTGDEDPTDEDKDTEVGDSEVLVSLGEISSGGRKSQESSMGDTEDGGKAVGEKTSVAKRYIVKSSEELGELFPDEAEKEDLEALWILVKERFSTTKPKNFSDDFLLVTLGAMFEKLDIHAQIWKNQRSVHGPAKVKGRKLLESCGVQILTFTTTQLILLVERKYTLTRFTLDQMLNVVRLEVEEESEVSLELLRFIQKRHQEGQLE
nr:hypothetical protein [Tanacetum cinerariifolium]GEW92125.1 hypothetical protein [Tanacetum cinerariifolium]